MFDSIFGVCRSRSGDVANAYQDPRYMADKQRQEASLQQQVQDIQKIVDAMCKIYYAENAKEIEARAIADKYFRTDQPLIDRARLLELQRKIMVAEMELKQLKRGNGL